MKREHRDMAESRAKAERDVRTGDRGSGEGRVCPAP